MKIALLGSIPKGDSVRRDWTDWKEAYKQTIQKVLPEAEFVDGDAISDNAGPIMVVGHDLAMIKNADMCVVDARSKIGAGTAQEIVIAKHLKKPVVSVIPKDTHHRKTNITFHGVTLEDWIHPFLYVSSDYVADSIEAAAQWVAKYANSDKATQSVKDLSIFEEAIEHYEKQSSLNTL
jgi:nucleoside 2-deoxyribosyltransferase